MFSALSRIETSFTNFFSYIALSVITAEHPRFRKIKVDGILHVFVAQMDTDQKLIEQSNEPHRQGHAPGGDYDPNERSKVAGSQHQSTNLSDSPNPASAHGGDYDPNHLDASYFPGQDPEQRYDSPSMAAKALRPAPPGQASFYDQSQTTTSSSPAGSRLTVGASIDQLLALLTHHNRRAPYLWES